MGLWKSAGFGRWILLEPGSIQEYVLPNSHPQLQQAWQNKWRNKGCKRPENEWSTKAEKDTQDYRKAYSRIEKACDVCKCTVRKCESAKHVLTKKLEKNTWETGRIISVTCLNKIVLEFICWKFGQCFVAEETLHVSLSPQEHVLWEWK